MCLHSPHLGQANRLQMAIFLRGKRRRRKLCWSNTVMNSYENIPGKLLEAENEQVLLEAKAHMVVGRKSGYSGME